MTRLFATAPALLLATPTLAHEIGMSHDHAGPIMLIDFPLAPLLGALAIGILALAVRKTAIKENRK